MSPAVAEWKALRASGHCLEFCLLTSPAVAEWKALRASGHCLEFCLLTSPAVAEWKALRASGHCLEFCLLTSPAVAEWKALRASGHCLEFCLLTSPAVAEWKALRASGHCLEFCLLMSPAVATALSFVCCRADSVTESLLSNSSTEILAGPCGVSNYFISCPIQFINFYFLKLCRHLLLYSFTDCALLCYIVICSHIFTYLVDLVN